MTTTGAIKQISVQEAKAKIDGGAQAIDVRPPADWAGGHVPGALNLPALAIKSRKGEVPADKDLLFFSEDGSRSVEPTEVAVTLGFGSSYNVEGGVRAWIAAGYDVEALN